MVPVARESQICACLPGTMRTALQAVPCPNLQKNCDNARWQEGQPLFFTLFVLPLEMIQLHQKFNKSYHSFTSSFNNHLISIYYILCIVLVLGIQIWTMLSSCPWITCILVEKRNAWRGHSRMGGKYSANRMQDIIELSRCTQPRWGWKTSRVMCHLTTGIHSYKCVIEWYHCFWNIIECTWTNLDGIVYYTPRLYGMAITNLFFSFKNTSFAL